MFLKENDNLYDKIDYAKRMSQITLRTSVVIGEKLPLNQGETNKVDDLDLEDESDEEEKEIVEMNFVRFAKKEKDINVLRRPRLFILPTIEKLKEMIRECVTQFMLGRLSQMSPTSLS